MGRGERHWSEPRVRRWLEAQGWRTLDANVCERGGELDLVMDDGSAIVFVEVRQRRGDSHGGAAESVDAGKQRRLRRVAARWLAARGWHDAPVRFDVVLVQGSAERARVRRVPDAF